MGPLQIQSTGQNSKLKKKCTVTILAFKKNRHIPTETNKNLSQFQELNSPSTKVGIIISAHIWLGSCVHKITPHNYP